MSQSKPALNWAPKALAESVTETPKPPMLQDRSIPAWAAVLSTLFTFGTAICYVALIIFALFLHQLVALDHIQIYAPILAACAVVPILGIVIFEMGHARALIGYPDLRRRGGPIGGAIASVLALGGLLMLHPLLTIPPVTGALLGWCVSRPLAHVLPREHSWNSLPAETAAVLSGRDKRGLDLLRQAKRRAPSVDILCQAIVAAVFTASFALTSWLAMREVLATAAIAPTALINCAITIGLLRYWRATSVIDPEHADQAASVIALPRNSDTVEASEHGLWVSRLSLKNPAGDYLLQDIAFHLPEGSIAAIVGDSFAGKSLLLHALTAPQDMTDLDIEGQVYLNGFCPWDRHAYEQETPIVHLPPNPLILPDSGHVNLLQPSEARAQRAEFLLKSLLHNADTTRRILNCRNATSLSHSEQKALAFTRAFCLRPALYLLDRPEDGCPEQLRGTLLNRLREETRRGASVLLVTEDRALLEACDQLISLQSGRLVEMASASEMRARASSGWQRFVAARELESEDALDSWINAQFRRDGDEANRRAICMVANEMLTLACRTDAPGAKKTLCFEMKLFVGRCVLRMQQPHPISSGALERARSHANSESGLTDAPLARILRDSALVENTHFDNQNWLEVTIEIYDPRKTNPPKDAEAPTHAEAQKNAGADT